MKYRLILIPTLAVACSAATVHAQVSTAANGNVGVGTASPAVKLHVFATNSPATIRVQSAPGGFGSSRVEFWSDPRNAATEWRPGWIQSTDNGNYTGGLAFFANGVGSSNKTSGLEVMRLVNRRVGIGTSSPQDMLHVTGAARVGYLTVNPQDATNEGGEIALRGAGSNPGWIMDVYGTRLRFHSGGTTRMSLTAGGKLTVDTLSLNGADVAENYDVTEEALPGMVVCPDPSAEGKLRLCTEAYDPTAIGIISGANGIQPGTVMGQAGTLADGAYPVAMVGRVYVLADATHGPIQPGSLLTSSPTAGHAMKADDRHKALGATLGTALTGLKEGKGYVLVAVQRR